MLLGELLHSGVVKIGLEATNKTEVIEELVDLLVEGHEITLAMRNHVIETVMEREKTMSTGMENGIALPHGSTDRVDDIVAALGIAPQGVPFESLDGQPARIIILLIMPKNKFQAHVRTLAGIAHLVGNETMRSLLLRSENPEDMLELIEKEESKDEFDSYRAE
jgi:mannitol/fructose-specific phosphotransferase system IIA component (Ntr-type)